MRLIPEQAERIAQRIWSRAPSLPDRVVRVGNLRRAYQLVKLARAVEDNTNLHRRANARDASGQSEA
jgi:hypothetical protein